MLTVERLRETLAYDPATGVFAWRHDRHGRGKPHKAGDVAGHVHKGHGYVVIKIDGAGYLGHRLAWLYVHGVWPSRDVDHRNQIRDDNRIENLRLASIHQNLMNVRRRETNTSGFKGVTFRKKHPSRPWRATINLYGKHTELGFFSTAQEAAEAYKAAAEKHFGEFARST